MAEPVIEVVKMLKSAKYANLFRSGVGEQGVVRREHRLIAIAIAIPSTITIAIAIQK